MKTSFHLDLVVNGVQGRTTTVCLNFATRTSEVLQQLFIGLLLTWCLLVTIWYLTTSKCLTWSSILAWLFSVQNFLYRVAWPINQLVLELFLEFHRIVSVLYVSRDFVENFSKHTFWAKFCQAGSNLSNMDILILYVPFTYSFFMKTPGFI